MLHVAFHSTPPPFLLQAYTIRVPFEYNDVFVILIKIYIFDQSINQIFHDKGNSTPLFPAVFDPCLTGNEK